MDLIVVGACGILVETIIVDDCDASGNVLDGVNV